MKARQFVQGPCILGHAERGIRAQQFGQVGCVVSGMRDGQRRIFGVDVNWRGVKRQLRSGFGDQEAGDAAYFDTERRVKGQRDPGRVFTLHQVKAFAIQVESDAIFAMRSQGEMDVERAAVLFHVIARAFNGAGVAAIGRLQREPVAARHFAFRRARGVQGEGALRAQQVRCAHGREQPPVEFFRRKRDGHAQDGGSDVVLAQNIPEGAALAAHLHGGTA